MTLKRQHIGFCVVLFIIATNAVYPQAVVSLDESIQAAVTEIEAKLTPGDKVVVLNVKAPSQRLSDYVLDEMTTVLVRNSVLIVVDRANLELIQQEMDFQLSGEVSDDSAQAIGQKLGAQSIISGSIEDIGDYFRIRFRTIEVKSAAIQVVSSLNVEKDSQVTFLISGSSSADTAYPHGLNFSSGRKVGAGFLNMVYGIGSFSMGDRAGGFIIGGTELVGTALVISGVVMIVKGNSSVNYNSETGETDFSKDTSQFSVQETAGVVIIVSGLLVNVVGYITGFVRPFTYDTNLAKKNGTYYSIKDANPLYHISLSPVPDYNSIGMGVFYGMSF